MRDANQSYLERVGSPTCLSAKKSLLGHVRFDEKAFTNMSQKEEGYNTTRVAKKEDFDECSEESPQSKFKDVQTLSKRACNLKVKNYRNSSVKIVYNEKISNVMSFDAHQT